MQKRILSFFLAGMLLPGLAFSQEEKPKKRFIVYEYQGEMIMDGSLVPVNITAPYPSRATMRDAQGKLARYTRLVWNVHRTYPYALKLGRILYEVDSTVKHLPNDKARDTYMKTREKSLFGEYEDDLRDMTRSQGLVLVKLISRETGNSAYDLIKDTKSGVSAFFWQSVGLIFGINLKSQYDREEDAMIEEIVAELHTGGYNIYYKSFNYRLP